MAFVLTFLLRRLAHGIVVVFLVSFLIFALLRVIPGDPVRMMLGLNVSQALLEQKAKELGLRDPVPVQYANFLYNLARGDLGRSYLLGESGGAAPSAQNKLGGQITAEEELARETRTTRASVLKLIGDGLPYTLQLAALGLLFTMIV